MRVVVVVAAAAVVAAGAGAAVLGGSERHMCGLGGGGRGGGCGGSGRFWIGGSSTPNMCQINLLATGAVFSGMGTSLVTTLMLTGAFPMARADSKESKYRTELSVALGAFLIAADADSTFG